VSPWEKITTGNGLSFEGGALLILGMYEVPIINKRKDQVMHSSIMYNNLPKAHETSLFPIIGIIPKTVANPSMYFG
jgi:hypothetical protein